LIVLICLYREKNNQPVHCVVLQSALHGLILFHHIHRQTGLEFYSEFVLKDSDFFNQPPYQSVTLTCRCVVIFRQGSRLLPQEGVHVGDALFLLISPGAFQLKLLLFPRAGGKSPRRRPHSRLGHWFALKAPPAVLPAACRHR